MRIVTPYIYGNAKSFQLYEGTFEDRNLFGAAYSGERSVNVRQMKIVRRNDGKTYYHYVCYGAQEFENRNSNANGVFGMSLLFEDNNYCPDFEGILHGFDSLTEEILSRKVILEKRANGVLHFLVNYFHEQKAEMEYIKQQMLKLVDVDSLLRYDESFSKGKSEQAGVLDDKSSNDEICEQLKNHHTVILRKIPSHKVTYLVDGEVFKSFEIVCGSDLPSVDEPSPKKGYYFSGWSNIPYTMPDKDVTIKGNFIEIIEQKLPETEEDSLADTLPVVNTNKQDIDTLNSIVPLYELFIEIVCTKNDETKYYELTQLVKRCNQNQKNKKIKNFVNNIEVYLKKDGQKKSKGTRADTLFPLNETHKALLLGAVLFVTVIVLFSILKGCNGAGTEEKTGFNDDAFQSYVQKGAYENAMNEIIRNKRIINRDTTHYYDILRTTMFNYLLSSLKSQSINKKEEFVADFFKMHHQVLQRLGCKKEELNYKNIALVYRTLQDEGYIITSEEHSRIQDAITRNPQLLSEEEQKQE